MEKGIEILDNIAYSANPDAGLTGLLLITLVRKISAMEKEVYANQHLLSAQPVIAQ